jgi:tRNA threonylcarbamoyladenosine biosynthesis protein TsaB
MAKILLIETSADVCSVALSTNGTLVAVTEQSPCPSHAAVLTLQIESCMAKAGLALTDLDAVAVSKGPGSYTSLRVGASVAKGICYALDKPLIAVDTLFALALASRDERQGRPEALYLPMVDARRSEVWLAAYDASMNLVFPSQPFVFENNSLGDLRGLLGVGQVEKVLVLSGNGAFKAIGGNQSDRIEISDIKKSLASFLEKPAIDAFQKNEFQDVVYFEPFYMKPPNITGPTKII